MKVLKSQYNFVTKNKKGEVKSIEYSNGDVARLLTVCNENGEHKMICHSHYDNDILTKTYLPVLEDKTPSGKECPWARKKANNEIVEKIYRSLAIENGEYYLNKADRLHDCASFLNFDMSKESNTLKLNYMNSCRVRLCPMCAWRRTLKISSNARKIFNYIETDEQYKDKYTYLFLTLTVPNCTGDNLSSTIDLLMNSWAKLMDRKEIKKIVKGWYRGLEITHNHDLNSKSYDTYHPHFHVIFMVNKSYLEHKNNDVGYISNKKWKMYWAESLQYFLPRKKGKVSCNKIKKPVPTVIKRKLTQKENIELIQEYSTRNYLCRAEREALVKRLGNKRKLAVKHSCKPQEWIKNHVHDCNMLLTAMRLMLQIDIRAIKPKDKNLNSDNPLARSGLINAICEITKYTVKDKDYIIPWDWGLSMDIVKTLDNSLERRRLVAWGGTLAKVRDNLKLDDEIDGDLTHIDDDNIKQDIDTMEVLALWNTGYQQYIIHSIKPKEINININN